MLDSSAIQKEPFLINTKNDAIYYGDMQVFLKAKSGSRHLSKLYKLPKCTASTFISCNA